MTEANALASVYRDILAAMSAGLMDTELPPLELEQLHIVMEALYMGLIGSNPQEVLHDATLLYAVLSDGDYATAHTLATALVSRGH